MIHNFIQFRWLLAPFLPLLWLYRFVVIARNFGFDRGIFKNKKIPALVISIGNLSVGGTGKTPLTIFLAKVLRDNGWRVAIVAKGYRRESRALVVVSDGQCILADAGSAGDEPLLMARACAGVPIVVAHNKTAAATAAFEKFSPDVILVDDGFQHRQLHRNLDVVLVDAKMPLSNLWWFPAWPLREPASSLCRADFIILNAGGQNYPRHLAEQCRQVTTAKIFFGALQGTGWRKLDEMNAAASEKLLPLSLVNDQPVVLVSGIAHPKRFRGLVEKFGARIVGEMAFHDHYRYRESDIRAIESTRKAAGARYILTTSKDAGKLAAWRDELTNFFLILETTFEVEADFVPALFSALQPSASAKKLPPVNQT